jgi:hypothetical protein
MLSTIRLHSVNFGNEGKSAQARRAENPKNYTLCHNNPFNTASNGTVIRTSEPADGGHPAGFYDRQ